MAKASKPTMTRKGTVKGGMTSKSGKGKGTKKC